jgi:predicted ABC-type ATPase
VAERKPALVVVAGPNGSGKTAITDILRGRHDWTDGLVEVNPDRIAQEEFGDWNDPIAILRAAKKADEIREDCLLMKRGLLFETVLSTPGKVEFMRRAKDAGFFVRLVYVATDSPEINVMRVAWRTARGGHDVPEDKIVARYARSLTLAVDAARVADRAYFVDNSMDAENPEELTAPFTAFRTVDGMVAKEYGSSDQLPPWTLPIYQALRS